MDRAGDRVRGVVHCGVWKRGVVHGVCAAARLWALCDLPHHSGDRGIVLRLAPGGLIRRLWSGNLDELRLVARLPFGMISEFLLSGVSSAASRSRHSAFPKMLRRNSCAF